MCVHFRGSISQRIVCLSLLLTRNGVEHKLIEVVHMKKRWKAFATCFFWGGMSQEEAAHFGTIHASSCKGLHSSFLFS